MNHQGSVSICLSYLSTLSIYLPTYLSLHHQFIQPSMHLTITYISAFASIHPSSMCICMYLFIWLPWWLSGKESSYNAGDVGSIPGSGRSPAKGNGNPFHYSCLGYPMGRGTWWATVHVFAKEWDTTQWLNNNNVSVCLSVYLSSMCKHHYCKEIV